MKFIDYVRPRTWWTRALDVVLRRPLAPLSAEHQEELADLVEVFLRTGGAFSVDEYLSLEHVERIAVLKVAEKIWRLRAAELGRAIRDVKGAATVIAPLDDGLALRTLAAIEALQGVDVPAEAC